MKKIIILVLALVMALPPVTLGQTYEGNLEQQVGADYDKWFQGLIRSGQVAKDAFKVLEGIGYMNRELYEDLGLVVYGSPASIHDNDFKPVAGGYYTHEGQAGEWRYHGYSVGGEKYPNDPFPLDGNADDAMEDVVWNYKPWAKESYGNRSYVHNYSDEGAPGVNSEILIKLKDFPNRAHAPEYLSDWVLFENQINEGFPFDLGAKASDASYVTDVIYTGDADYDASVIGGDRNFINYAAVSQQPTAAFNGGATMFLKSKHGEGRYGAWYWTMPIEKVDYKFPSRAEAQVSVFDKAYDKASKTWHLRLLLTSELMDGDVYVGSESEVKIQRQTHINREDIKSWDMVLTSPDIDLDLRLPGKRYYPKGTKASDKKYGSNCAFTFFEVDLSPDLYESLLDEAGQLQMNFVGTATANLLVDDGKVSAMDTTDTSVTVEVPEMEEVIMPVPKPARKKLAFEVDAPKEILDKWVFPLKESITESEGLASQHVLLEGVRLSEVDQRAFLSGTYKFPEIGKDKIYTYKIMYEHVEGEFYYYQSFVVVYDHKPRFKVNIENYSKVNRRMSVEVDYSITPQFVKDHTSIGITAFDVVSDQAIHYGENRTSKKVFLIKDVASVDLNIVVANEYGSRSYESDLYVGEDLRPDIFAMVWNNYVARKDRLNITSEQASLDGDLVSEMTYVIRYDSDFDGQTDQEVYKGVWTGSTDFKPEKLGFYDITWSVKESFGQPTLEAFITEDDYKTYRVTRELFVENIVPMTKLYTDIEYNFPKLDVMVIMDSGLNASAVQNVKSNAVNLRNAFRLNSMVADVQIWDTKTYIQSTAASKTLNTGGTYPSSTLAYNQNGYTGSLSRLNVSNSPYSIDEGWSVSHTTSQTVEASRSDSGSGPPGTPRSSSNVPYSIHEQGTTLYEIPGSYSYSSEHVVEDGVASTWKYTWSRSASYRGTVSTTTSVWQSNWVNYNNYSGYYSGTVYKKIKQDFKPRLQVDSNKYIIYVTDHELSSDSVQDFKKIKGLAKDSDVYVMMDDQAKIHSLGDVSYEAYRDDVMGPLEAIVKDIKTKNPVHMAFTVLPHESFNLSHTDSDYEGDPLVNDQAMFYVHDKDFFDNPTGQEPATYANYNYGAWTPDFKTSFSNVGKYTVHRKIKDQPLGFEDKGLESNLASIEIVVHRRPIADYTLDWVYDPVEASYETTWLDQSYDLDFEFSDPIKKGIVDRKIKYRKNKGAWIHEIPENLLAGTYDLEYVVQDSYGAWSEVKRETFVLDPAPSVQMLSAHLRPLKADFSLEAIPHTEALVVYGIKTRYPYDHDLYYQWFLKGRAVSDKIAMGVHYTNKDSDRLYDDFILQIDKNMSNNYYQLKVSAEDGSHQRVASKIFDVGIHTPIGLQGAVPERFNTGKLTLIAQTSSYVDHVDVLALAGTAYESQVSLVDQGQGQWSGDFEVNEHVPEGAYDFTFVARIDSKPTMEERQVVGAQRELLAVTVISLRGDWSYYARQENIFNEALSYNDHRFLSLENLNLHVETLGKPDKIEVYVPKEFLETYYRDESNEVYNNNEWVSLMPEVFEVRPTKADTFDCSFEVPLVASSLSTEDVRLRPPYVLKVVLLKGQARLEYVLDDIEVTGNIFDHLYLQPKTD